MTSQLTFVPFQTRIAPEFWQLLSQRKIDTDKLDVKDVPCIATFDHTATKSVRCRLDLDQYAFTESERSTAIHGFVRNTNTLEEFNQLDKNEFLHAVGEKLTQAMQGSPKPSELSTFALLCFCDLKKYTYTYWMAHPVFSRKWSAESVERSEDAMNDVCEYLKTNPSDEFLVYDRNTRAISTGIKQDQYVIFIDSSSDDRMSWSMQNLLHYLSMKGSTINVLAYRGPRIPSLLLKSCTSSGEPSLKGWERTIKGQLSPQSLNLQSSIDPTILADDAVDLNLKLMKWRVATDLNLKKLKDMKCLLLGAGTLGCFVSRLLMAWGVDTITFVDNSRVSFSNPVRQPLYKFTDCIDGGTWKAECAASALKEVKQSINASGVNLSIPMLGHSFTSTTEQDHQVLSDLIESHDIIYLLMDSRESRWLPTVIATSLNKPVINAALGFDTYLVQRHGISNQSPKLGCYFCNDVVVPGNSMQDRTLDQMCTVTRPGLAAMASAIAVEILSSATQHHDSFRAGVSEGALGIVPHIVRGYLRTHQTILTSAPAFENCSACSDHITNAYRTSPSDFLHSALSKPTYIDQLSGLLELQQSVDALNLDWDD